MVTVREKESWMKKKKDHFIILSPPDPNVKYPITKLLCMNRAFRKQGILLLQEEVCSVFIEIFYI